MIAEKEMIKKLMMKLEELSRHDYILILRSLPYSILNYFENIKIVNASSSVVLNTTKEWKLWNRSISRVICFMHPRFYLAAKISRLTFSFIGIPPRPYPVLTGTTGVTDLAVAQNIVNLFSYSNFGEALSWVSKGSAIKNEVNKITRYDDFIPSSILEFGPGIGINPIISSINYNKSKIISYDTPLMIELQKKVHNYWNEVGFCLDAKRFEYKSDLNKLLISLENEISLEFISYHSFSETPISLRRLFLPVLKMAKLIIIVSNPDIFGIDNNNYFRDLSMELQRSHQYATKPLPIVYNSDRHPIREHYLSKHLIHIYWQ